MGKDWERSPEQYQVHDSGQRSDADETHDETIGPPFTSLEKIVIVTGYEEKLKTFLSRLDISTPVEYVDNPLYASTNNIYSLYLAKDTCFRTDTFAL